MKRSVVVKDGLFLKLEGKFEYPTWTSFVHASRLSPGKAASWADALGATTLSLDFSGKPPGVEVEEKSPDTVREGTRQFEPQDLASTTAWIADLRDDDWRDGS